MVRYSLQLKDLWSIACFCTLKCQRARRSIDCWLFFYLTHQFWNFQFYQDLHQSNTKFVASDQELIHWAKLDQYCESLFDSDHPSRHFQFLLRHPNHSSTYTWNKNENERDYPIGEARKLAFNFPDSYYRVLVRYYQITQLNHLKIYIALTKNLHNNYTIASSTPHSLHHHHFQILSMFLIIQFH